MKDQAQTWEIVPDTWESASLKELCSFHNGLWKGKKEPFETATVIRNTNFTADGKIDLSNVAVLEVEAKQLAKRKLIKNDIIIEKSGGGPKQPVGRVVLFDIDHGVFSFSNFTSAIRVQDVRRIDPKYLQIVLHYWYISGRTEQLQSHSTGIRNLDFNSYKELKVPLPPLEEQKRIVAVLDQAFAALDRARAHAEANLADAEELFENYLANVFSNGGEVWSSCHVGDAITLQRGFDITKKYQRDGPFPVISSGGAKSFHNEAKATAPGVVIGRKGSIGSVYYVEQDFWPHDTTLYVKDFKGNNELLVYYLLRGLKLAQFDTGAANPSLNRNLVHPLPIMWPTKENQNAAANRLQQIEALTQDLRTRFLSKLTDIAHLRQSLLQKAFSGQII